MARKSRGPEPPGPPEVTPQLGRLGRNRVSGLYRPGVEIPSDYSGVLYQEFDEKGAWRLELARELKAAGLPVDMNKAL